MAVGFALFKASKSTLKEAATSASKMHRATYQDFMLVISTGLNSLNEQHCQCSKQRLLIDKNQTTGLSPVGHNVS